jgi:hypothetical protein
MHEPVVPTLPKTGEGWGTLACGTSIQVKGVGQECLTHTSMSDSRHVELLFVLCKRAGDSWFSEIVPGFAV